MSTLPKNGAAPTGMGATANVRVTPDHIAALPTLSARLRVLDEVPDDRLVATIRTTARSVGAALVATGRLSAHMVAAMIAHTAAARGFNAAVAREIAEADIRHSVRLFGEGRR